MEVLVNIMIPMRMVLVKELPADVWKEVEF